VKRLARYHGGSISQALLDLFPNIGLSASKLRKKSTDNTTGRQFFENYAHLHGFDPLSAESWYLQSQLQIKSEIKAPDLLRRYGESVSRALVSLFPDVKFKISNFKRRKNQSSNELSDRDSRRVFFEKFAVERGFDPLDAVAWYRQSNSSLCLKKDAQKVLEYYENDFGKALLDLFPDIGLAASKFAANKRTIESAEDQRTFLEGCARQLGFDPLITKTWYSRSIRKILAANPVQTRSIKRFHGSLSSALMNLFPDIGLEQSKLVDLPRVI